MIVQVKILQVSDRFALQGSIFYISERANTKVARAVSINCILDLKCLHGKKKSKPAQEYFYMIMFIYKFIVLL